MEKFCNLDLEIQRNYIEEFIVIIEQFIEIALNKKRRRYTEDEMIFLDKLEDYPHLITKTDNYFLYDFFLLPIIYSTKQEIKDISLDICQQILDTQPANFENLLEGYIMELIDLQLLLKRKISTINIHTILQQASGFNEERINSVYLEYKKKLEENGD